MQKISSLAQISMPARADTGAQADRARVQRCHMGSVTAGALRRIDTAAMQAEEQHEIRDGQQEAGRPPVETHPQRLRTRGGIERCQGTRRVVGRRDHHRIARRGRGREAEQEERGAEEGEYGRNGDDRESVDASGDQGSR